MKAVFLDIETNGLDYNRHNVLEIAVIVVNLCTNERLFTYSAIVQTLFGSDWNKSDKDALKISGINSDLMLREGKNSYQVMCELEDLFAEHRIFKGEAFFICQNPSFDRPFFEKIIPSDHIKNLNFPYHWLDLASMWWIRFFACCYPIPQQISLSKDTIASSFGIPPEEKPHRALNGVEHLIKCYKACCLNHFQMPPIYL